MNWLRSWTAIQDSRHNVSCRLLLVIPRWLRLSDSYFALIKKRDAICCVTHAAHNCMPNKNKLHWNSHFFFFFHFIPKRNIYTIFLADSTVHTMRWNYEQIHVVPITTEWKTCSHVNRKVLFLCVFNFYFFKSVCVCVCVCVQQYLFSLWRTVWSKLK